MASIKDEITWAEEATTDFDTIIAYLTSAASDATVRKFVSTFYRKLDLLAGMPYMGVKSQKRTGSAGYYSQSAIL